MVLKGLPETFKLFAIHVSQSKDRMTFPEFKTKLRSYENIENMRIAESEDNEMKVGVRFSTRQESMMDSGSTHPVCYKSATKGHIARTCLSKQWCKNCKSAMHNNAIFPLWES